MEERTVYEQLGRRTDGNVYLGVVGPVRTGKSTFVKRMMEALVIPGIEDPYQKQRARDELPQSGSGRTITTSEPKFVPEEAVEISPDGKTRFSVRFIDSVGYMVDGAIGAMEDGQERTVSTPWFDYPIPMSQAAEVGTKKVMEDHCTIGVVVTTDGSVTDIDRQAYQGAEARAIRDMQATGKPFVVLVNSSQPDGPEARRLQEQIQKTYGSVCLAVDCLNLDEGQIRSIWEAVLEAYPISELWFYLPKWIQALDPEDTLKEALYAAIRRSAGDVSRISEAEAALASLEQLEAVEDVQIRNQDLGTGIVSCEIRFPQTLFYRILGEKSGFAVENDGDLFSLLENLSRVKKEYDKVSAALEQVRATGYGVVMPDTEEMELEQPEIVKKGGRYGVRLRASAPSIHMMLANIQTEISPMVGDEKQSEDMVNYLLGEYEEDAQKLWQSNLFGKSVYELVSEGLSTKLKRMPETAQYKLQQTLSRIINEGNGGLICILL